MRNPASDPPSLQRALPGVAGESLVDDLEKAARVADILAALGNPTRLRIVSALAAGEENVSGLSERLGLPQPCVSQQLSILRMRGLVDVVRTGGFAFYHIAEPRLRTVISCMEKCRKR